MHPNIGDALSGSFLRFLIP